jgi:formate-dependent nitrite reductase cytochrome c552 subunit
VPFQSGFLGLEATPHLTGNGCENCHGPGGAHVAAEAGKDAALQAKLRQLMHLDLANAEQAACRKCHDHDNSPEFKFETYWPQIEH